jgi:hypothetical protein
MLSPRGYAVERNVILVQRRDPHPGPAVVVEELPFADVRPLFQEVYRRVPWTTDETAPTFAEQHGKYERVIGARFFVVLEGDLAGNASSMWTASTRRSRMWTPLKSSGAAG